VIVGWITPDAAGLPRPAACFLLVCHESSSDGTILRFSYKHSDMQKAEPEMIIPIDLLAAGYKKSALFKIFGIQQVLFSSGCFFIPYQIILSNNQHLLVAIFGHCSVIPTTIELNAIYAAQQVNT
jgi:hypothetical protein